MLVLVTYNAGFAVAQMMDAQIELCETLKAVATSLQTLLISASGAHAGSVAAAAAMVGF